MSTFKPISRITIKEVATKIARKIHPEKIVLFGSYAYGRPCLGSDVDFLVVLKTKKRNLFNERLRISHAISPHPFGIDIVVQTAERLEKRINEGDFFLRDIVNKGKIVYEKTHKRMDRKSRV